MRAMEQLPHLPPNKNGPAPLNTTCGFHYILWYIKTKAIFSSNLNLQP